LTHDLLAMQALLEEADAAMTELLERIESIG